MRETYTLSITKRINPYFLFFLICIFLYLPSSLLRGPFYPDEIRNIHIAKSIATFKGLFFLKYLGISYYEKPPLYFWFLKLFSKFPFHNFLFLPVLFNTLICWGILSLNYLFLKREGYAEIGFFSSLFLSVTAVVYGMAIIVRMDMLFLLFIFLSFFLLRVSLKNHKKHFIFLSSLFSFFAVFTKGALGIILPFSIGLGMMWLGEGEKKVVVKRVVSINILVLVGILLWFYLFSQGDPQYFKMMFFEQTLLRAFNPPSHKHFFLYYLPFLFVFFLPWTFMGIGYFLSLRKNNIYSWEKFYLLWLVGGFAILSFIRSKLPMYLLLLAIPFCGLTAKFFIEGDRRLKKKLFYSTATFFLLLWLIVFCYFKIKGEFIPPSAFLVLLLFAAAFLFTIGREPLHQLRNFSIFWFILIQMSNFVYLPLASSFERYNRIAVRLKGLKIPFNKVYVTERPLLQLSIYLGDKPIVYLKEKNICEDKSFIVISSNKDIPCVTKEILRADELYFFYKE
jgi:4-amino-4-deoxy-L-arabinose transferase-like glycosyltransferase